jgi:hypothetical protein
MAAAGAGALGRVLAAAKAPAGRRVLLGLASLSIVWTLGGYARTLASALRHGRITEFDDAYMFVRYADNLIAGRGVSWNPDGAPTLGATTLPYLFVIAALRRFVHVEPGLLVVIASSSFGLVAALVLCATFARTVGARSALGAALVAGALLPLILARPIFVYHAFSGMETTLAVLVNALVILATRLLVERPTGARAALAGGLSFAAYAVRPDSAVLALLYPAISILLSVPRARSRRLLAVWLGVAACLIGADLGLKAAVFGDPRPLSLFVKRFGYYAGFDDHGMWNPVTYLAQFTASFWPCLAVPLALAKKRHARELGALLLPAAVSVAYDFTVHQIMGLEARFYLPLLPGLVAGAAVVLRDRRGEGEPWALPARLPARLAGLALLVLFPTLLEAPLARAYAGAFMRTKREVPRARMVTTALRPLPPLGWFGALQEMSRVAASLPAGVTMAATEVGLVGAAAPQVTIVDMSGLNDVFLARHGFSVPYLLERRPDLVWMPAFVYSGMLADLLDSDELHRDYDLYRSAYGTGIAVRREGPHRAEVEGALRRGWDRVYPGVDMNDYLVRWE